MAIKADETSGVWVAEQPGEPPQALALRQGLLERLDKADGHINAADHKLWHETERGLWSARQAQARVAEVWLGLAGELAELPPLERYLQKDVVRERMKAFATVAKSAPLEAAWQEVTAAEAAVLAEPFPMLSSPLPDPQREALHAGLARQNRYIKALRALVGVVETAFAGRFVALRPGDWLRLEDRALGNHMLLEGFAHQANLVKERGVMGEMLALRGLTAWLFIPAFAEHGLEEAIRGYHLAYARLARVEPPPTGPITAPGYYWLARARQRLREARHLLQKSDRAGFAKVRDALFDGLDAAAKAWWATFAPGEAPLSWRHLSREAIYALNEQAPPGIAAPLAKAMRSIERLSGWRGGQRVADSDPGGSLQLAVILEVAEKALAALEELVEPEIDLAAGDWVRLSSGRAARIAERDGVRLMLDMGRQGMREARLFQDFLQRIAPPDGQTGRSETAQQATVATEPDIAEIEHAISEWDDAVGWTEKGWDCIEDYQLDVGCRKALDELVERFGGETALPEALRLRLRQADDRFRAATKEARISIFDCGPKFQYLDEEHIRLLPLNEFDPERHWYFYRWQPDCPYSWEGHDAYSYQKTVYGLDFLNMTEEQLLDAVRREVARWKQQAGT